jgi:4-hydroxybenzoate polyprenyltransferase
VTTPEDFQSGATSSSKPGVRLLQYARLARPHQWSKSAFVLIGPLYGLRDLSEHWAVALRSALAAAVVFALVSSACYVINDLVDAPKDRLHPRKQRRPIASGEISPRAAIIFAIELLLAGAVCLLAIDGERRLIVGALAAVYAANVVAYSVWFKRIVIADVMGLSLGFVLRVFAGCAAVGIAPTTWLLNCTLFLAMFLSFGKRLGERRTMGGADGAISVRGVQAFYTDDLLRMAVVVTAVATLITYAGYVQANDKLYALSGLNLLWFTMIPATFGLLRCIVLLEGGAYDDPTELAGKDRAFQLAMITFGAITAALIVLSRQSLGATSS